MSHNKIIKKVNFEIKQMDFRHFYRHSYSFFLDWEEIKSLVSSLTNTWEQLKRELKVFLRSINADIQENN